MIAAPCVVTTGCPAHDPSFESTPNIRDRALSLPALHALLCVVAPSNRGKIPGEYDTLEQMYITGCGFER